MFFPPVPNSFIYSCGYLGWRDVLWGYRRELVSWEFVVGFAEFCVSNGSACTQEIDMVCLGLTDIQEIEAKLCSLAESETDILEVGPKEKWLYVGLKWLFEHKYDVADPLGLVELMYEDFDFPVEMECFVRYMPPLDGYNPKEYSDDQNLDRIFLNWNDYLAKVGCALGQSNRA